MAVAGTVWRGAVGIPWVAAWAFVRISNNPRLSGEPLSVCAQLLRGTDTADAVLAALAIENGATLASTDAGFRRFPDLRWVNPLAGA